MKQTPIKSSHVASFNEQQTNYLIVRIELNLTEIALEMEAKREPLQKAKEFYEEALADYDRIKKEYDAIQERYDLAANTKEMMVRFKHGPSDKVVRVMTTTSAADKPGRAFTPSGVKWMDLTLAVLEREQRFMKKEELFTLVSNFDLATQKSIAKMGKPTNILRSTVIHNWERATNLSKTKKKGKIVEYQGRIGKFDWTFDDLTPEPKYIKHFMSA